MSSRLCEHKGCSEPVHAKGYCRSHYARWRRGEPMGGWRGRGKRARKGPCIVKGCSEISHARGYCKRHYSRKWRGKPLEEDPRPDDDFPSNREIRSHQDSLVEYAYHNCQMSLEARMRLRQCVDSAMYKKEKNGTH